MLHTTHNNQIQAAMVMMVTAMLIIPGIDVIAKWMSATIGAGQAAWARFVFQTVLMFPLVIFLPGKPFASGVWVHVARGTMIAGATVLFFAAIKFLPIADAIAIFFVEPLMVTLLAAVFLKERVGWRRLSAISVGLLGAILVIQPNFERFGLTSALPLGTALCFAIYILLTRSVSQREDPAVMQFYAGVFGGITMSIALLLGHSASIPALSIAWPSTTEWLLLTALGLIATIAHLLVVHAFKRAPVGVLAPFQYVEIVSATLFGYFIFNDLPDVLTFCGVAIIISSGLYVFYRERQLAVQQED